MHHHHWFQLTIRILPIVLFLLTCPRVWSAQLVWTNTAGGNWTNAINWQPAGVPTLNDSAVITNGGTYTVTISSAASAGTIQMGYADTNASGIRTLALTAGSLTLTNAILETNATLNFSAGALTVRGVALARGDFTWTAGSIDGGGELQAGSGFGITTISGAGAKSLSGVTFGNFSYAGSWNGANLTASAGATFYNSGNLTMSGDQTFALSSGSAGFDNYGTLNKNGGAGQFLLSSVRFRNSGNVNISSGNIAFSAVTATNTGSLNFLAGNQLLFNSGTLQLGGSVSAPGFNTVQLIGGTVTITSPNISSPSIWISGATVQQQTNISVASINQSAGTYQLTLACNLGTYNLTNGILRGGTLTVTNFNWTDGALYADLNGDRLIIPTNGIFNLLGAGEKSLYYFAPATLGYGVDNYGTWNWSGACILRGFGSTVNNYGTVTLTAPTLTYYSYYSLSYPTPRWNNYGTFNKSAGAGVFSFNGAIVNNTGTLNVQAGTCTFDSSTKFTNSAAIIVGATATLLNDGASESTWLPSSTLTAATANSVRIPSGAVYLQSTNLATPALWINGGTLYQQAPNVVSNLNQSAGTWWLSVITAVNTYNLTNGTLRGGTLTVTNFAWTDGALYANTNGDKLIIPAGGVFNLLGAGEKSLSYFAPATLGYGVDNYGNWNWSGSCILRGFGSTVNNYGTVNMTATGTTYYSYYSVSYPTPTWNNYGTFTKSGGAGIFYFNGIYLNNLAGINSSAGTLSVNGTTFANSGTMGATGTLLQFYGATGTNTGSINLGAGTPMTVDNGSVITFAPTAFLSAPTLNSVQIISGSLALASTNLNTPSIWINGGTLYQRTNIAVNTINESGGALQLEVPCLLSQFNQTNGELRGRSLTVTNWNWIAGDHNRSWSGGTTNDDRTIIAPGGVMNLLGTAQRTLSYYTFPSGPGRAIDNYGTINWSGDAIIAGYGSVNNYGTTTVSGAGQSQFYWNGANTQLTWNNYGTFTRSAGTIFYFNNSMLINAGFMDIQQGTLSIYNSAIFTNASGFLTLGASAILQTELNGAITLNGASRLVAPTVDSIRLGGVSAVIETTNIVSPSLWLQAGTLYQRTNIAVNTINESGGALQLEVPCVLNQFNQTNGELRGRSLTVTNWNWIAGDHNRSWSGGTTNDDRTIIPLGGVMNLLGTAQRTLSYYTFPSGPGRAIDNFGTINWSGDAIIAGYGVVNNYGTTTVSGVGQSQFYWNGANTQLTWNNYGTFTRSAGTFFYFSNSRLNNSGLVDIQQGTLSIYNSAFFTSSAGLLRVGASGVFQSELNGSVVFGAASRVEASAVNSIRLGGVSAVIETTNIVSPSLWLQAGTLYQRTNIAVNTINESGGALQLEVPCVLNQFNETNGNVHGRSLTVTNWNWFAGDHLRSWPGGPTNEERTIIPPGGVMNFLSTATRTLSFYTAAGPGRGLDNFGTINWSGDAIIAGYGVVNNYGTTTVSGVGQSQFYWNGANTQLTWNNYGTFTRSAGTFFYFSNSRLNNSGLMDIQQGTLSIYNSAIFTNSAGLLNVGASGVFQSELNGAVTFGAASRLVAPTVDSIRLGGVSAVIETTNIVSPSLWLQAGTLYQRTNIAVNTLNESGGALQLEVPCVLNQFNETNGNVHGRSLTVTNWNWFAGDHLRSWPGGPTNEERTIIPPGGVMNFLSTATRTLSYYTAAGPGRGLDNFGTINWSGNAVLTGYGVVNNYGTATVSAVGAPQFYWNGANTQLTWNNYGTFTRSAGTVFYFNNSQLNNAGLMDIQQGTLSIYNSAIFTNLSGGNILTQPGAVWANDVNANSVFDSGSSVACASTNAFQINSGTVTLRSPSVTAPSLWINGGVLKQNANIATPVINESAGTWQLNVPVSMGTYNLTNGELRGANLTLNNFNWLGGSLNSDGAGSNLVTVASTLNIVGAAAKSMSYYTAPGRTVINNGNAVWGGGSITFSGQSSFVNNGNWDVTNDVALGWTFTGSAAPLFQNNGTFTKSAGPGVLTLGSTAFTNNGTVAINSGGISIGGDFVQTAGSAFLGTNFNASSNVRILTGALSGRGSIAGAYYNNGAANPGSSPGYINGNTFTNTAAATYNVELGGTTGAGTNYDQLRFSGPVTLDGTLNVSLYNNFALILSNRFTVLTTSARTGTFASVIPPPGATLNTIYSSTNVILEVVGLTNAPLQVLTNPVSQTIWTPDPVTFSVSVSGVTPISFQWLFNGTNISGAVATSYTIPAVNQTNAGLYSVLVTDGNGGTTNVAATLTVIPFTGTIWWTNTLGGNWSLPANWLPNRIPNGTNNVLIVSNGTYTVNVDVPAALSNLTVGVIGAIGSPTVHLMNGQSLTVNGSTTWETNSILALNGLMQMNRGGSNSVRGHIDWQLGTLSGAGRTVIATNASLTFVGSLNQKFIATNILENYGTFNYGNDSFGNAQGLRFSGGAQLTNYASGIISIGTAAYDYSGAQTPRSYLVNYGTINANSANVFSPVYLSIDFINYGTLQDNGYIYISRGTNYGTFSFGNTLCEVSVFGDETSGEYFSFENGTSFVGTYPSLAVGGYAQWNSTSVHPGRVTVLSGSGGYSFASPEFRILKNYTQSGQTIVYKGRWTQANPALTADLNDFSDSLVNGGHTFVITNAGTLRANNFSHNVRNLFNSGSIAVRSNLTLAGSSYTYGSGVIIITNGASATFSGGTVEAQNIFNRGTNSVTGALAFTSNTFYRNYAGARTYFGGGSFVTGPAALLNEGLLDGFGGLAITTVTNRGTVLANDSLNRSLALGLYRQESGLTELSPGSVSGTLDIVGGVLSGTNTVAGSVRNAASIAPGKPFGLLSVTGNFTNTVGATYFMPINGARAITNFPQTQIAGTAVLAGTLYVNFTNGFNPVPGNLFTAMVFTARSGTFDSVVNDTYGLEAFYSATNLILRAQNLLPNVSLSVQGGNNQLVCQTFRINASATDPDGVVTNLIVRLDGAPVASSTGAAIKTVADSDFPTTFALVAQATDDRSGVRSITNLVTIFNFTQTNLLFLGGVRTNDFKLCLVGETGRNYQVQGITNLASTNWVNLGTMIQSNGTWRYLDQRTITNRPFRFYRTEQLP